MIASAAGNPRAEGLEILRIQASPSFTALWLLPRLSRFTEEHPDITVRLSAPHVHTGFSQSEIDISICYGQSQWPDLHVEMVFKEEMLPLISPRLKEKLNLCSPEELLFQNLILSDGNLVQWPQWFAAQGVSISPSRYAVICDGAYLSIEAAVQGLGIALESDRLAEGALRRGLLVPAFPYRCGVRVYCHHLVYPPSHAKYGKVQRFVSWMRGEI